MKLINVPAAALTVVFAFACGGGEPASDAGEGAGESAPAVSQPAAEAPALARGANRIEYEVTGHLQASGTETDVMLCSTTEGSAMEARSLGDWVINFEVAAHSAGTHEVRLSVGAPEGMVQHESVARDDRFRGNGQITIKDAGTDAFGMRIMEAEFSGSDLVNQYDQVIEVKGRFTCSLLG